MTTFRVGDRVRYRNQACIIRRVGGCDWEDCRFATCVEIELIGRYMSGDSFSHRCSVDAASLTPLEEEPHA